MKKIVDLKMATMATFPLPVTLVTSIGKSGQANIMVVTYIAGVNEQPPMFGIGIRPQKYSNTLIKQTKEFVINIPTSKLIREVDYCGTHSGRNVQKFRQLNLTPLKAKFVQTPLIAECPINVECKLRQIIKLPSHDFFVGEVVAISIDKELINYKKNKHCVFLPKFDRLSFLFTTFLDYRIIGKKIGTAFEENKKISYIKPKTCKKKEEKCQ